MLMVSGDERACVEAHEFFRPVETAIVKRGVGRNRAELVDLTEARARIREAARRAMALVGTARPFSPTKPMEIRLEVTRADYADGSEQRDGVERLDARTLRKVTSCALELFP
jgi:D-amino peptidase